MFLSLKFARVCPLNCKTSSENIEQVYYWYHFLTRNSEIDGIKCLFCN